MQRNISTSLYSINFSFFAIQTLESADALSSHPDINETLQMIEKHSSTLFKEDIPLYIAIVHRLHLEKSIYMCEGLHKFVVGCLQKIEALQPEELAKLFNPFLERYCFFFVVE